MVLIVQAFMVFNYALIVDRGLNAWEATVASFRGVKRNFLAVIWLEFVCGVVLVVATLLCCLPVCLALPWVLGAHAVAYAQIFPRDRLATVFD